MMDKTNVAVLSTTRILNERLFMTLFLIDGRKITK